MHIHLVLVICLPCLFALVPVTFQIPHFKPLTRLENCSVVDGSQRCSAEPRRLKRSLTDHFPFYIDRKQLTRNKTIFGSILGVFLKLITGLNDYVTVSAQEDHVVQFDTRKREDAYNVTNPKEFPYAVLVLVMDSMEDYEECSGSLITLEWVLTAAHCLYDADAGTSVTSAWVYAGGVYDEEALEAMWRASKLPKGAQMIEAEHIIYHPKYLEHPMSFDIGLVKTSKKFVLSDTVNVIQLTTKPWDHVGYVRCVTTGFGAVRELKKSPDDGKRKTQYIYAKRPCVCSFMLKFVYNYFEGGKGFEDIICAKPRQDYGICSGDSGSGLVCEEDGAMRLRGVSQQTQAFNDVDHCEIGILEYLFMDKNEECGGKNVVSMFQEIYPHLDWINNYMNATYNISTMPTDLIYQLPHGRWM